MRLFYLSSEINITNRHGDVSWKVLRRRVCLQTRANLACEFAVFIKSDRQSNARIVGRRAHAAKLLIVRKRHERVNFRRRRKEGKHTSGGFPLFANDFWLVRVVYLLTFLVISDKKSYKRNAARGQGWVQKNPPKAIKQSNSKAVFLNIPFPWPRPRLVVGEIFFSTVCAV